MSIGELVIRWTIRAALVCCAMAAAEMLRSGPTTPGRWARLWWTAGFVLYVAHVAAAFEFEHHWSHAAAYHHTAQQTYKVVGIEWGGGIYFNYVFTLAWLVDVLTLWVHVPGHTRWSRRLRLAWYAFFAFMVVNAAIVFAQGPVRWISVAMFVILGALGFVRCRRISRKIRMTKPE